jgi:hypothetical protein
MNCLFWNCRGAGGKLFPALVKDIFSIYQLDFLAILEPRISGRRADAVIKKIGLFEGARVEAQGFSGGIWCLWKNSCPPISVISSSQFCIHIQINPNTQNAWYLSIVYASPHMNQREAVWEEIKGFKTTISGPWCVAGDFNQVLFDHEKQGGGSVNSNGRSAFQECIDTCQLLDLGFQGQPFTWRRGPVKERLDRVLGNADWQNLFPNSNITHLPINSSDHSGLWLRLGSNNNTNRRNYFKFLGSWLEHPDFEQQVIHSWSNSDNWQGNVSRLTDNLKSWNKNTFGNIFRKKHRIIKRLEGINNKLLIEDNESLHILRDQLWNDYNTILDQEEGYWYQQMKSKWVQLGDKNTNFFH